MFPNSLRPVSAIPSAFVERKVVDRQPELNELLAEQEELTDQQVELAEELVSLWAERTRPDLDPSALLGDEHGTIALAGWVVRDFPELVGDWDALELECIRNGLALLAHRTDAEDAAAQAAPPGALEDCLFQLAMAIRGDGAGNPRPPVEAPVDDRADCASLEGEIDQAARARQRLADRIVEAAAARGVFYPLEGGPHMSELDADQRVAAASRLGERVVQWQAVSMSYFNACADLIDMRRANREADRVEALHGVAKKLSNPTHVDSHGRTPPPHTASTRLLATSAALGRLESAQVMRSHETVLRHAMRHAGANGVASLLSEWHRIPAAQLVAAARALDDLEGRDGAPNLMLEKAVQDGRRELSLREDFLVMTLGRYNRTARAQAESLAFRDAARRAREAAAAAAHA
ncbi:hypothetical protein [Ramlibacter sp.]|uniref:hypothetical protein n=1 Tax=Ramlibacter sp. TaxID=1917967 RepID=UPI003D10FF24